MTITIHQPEHLPWLGLFHKIDMADTYIVLDNVQYRRRYFQNRNKIRTDKGWQWLTVPIENEDRNTLQIKDARICNVNDKWKRKNLESIFNHYHRAQFFDTYWDQFKTIYLGNHEHLMEFNVAIIKFFLETLYIRTEIRFASEMNVNGKKGDLILNLCLAAGAGEYISGISGHDYLDLEKFEKSGIKVVFQEFHHPIYTQCHEPFIPCMSVVDLLFNYGPDSSKIINGVSVPVIEQIFV